MVSIVVDFLLSKIPENRLIGKPRGTEARMGAGYVRTIKVGFLTFQRVTKIRKFQSSLPKGRKIHEF